MKATKGRLRLSAMLLACNLAFIWGNSALPGALSQLLTDWLRGAMGLAPQAGVVGGGLDLLRKAAHFTEFAALGGLLTWRMTMLGKPKRQAFFLGAAAACIDETIQIFAPDRGPGLMDVALDCTGVAAGMLAVYFGYTLYKKNHNLEEKVQ